LSGITAALAVAGNATKGFDVRNGSMAPQVRPNVQPLFDYQESSCDPRSVQGRLAR